MLKSNYSMLGKKLKVSTSDNYLFDVKIPIYYHSKKGLLHFGKNCYKLKKEFKKDFETLDYILNRQICGNCDYEVELTEKKLLQFFELLDNIYNLEKSNSKKDKIGDIIEKIDQIEEYLEVIKNLNLESALSDINISLSKRRDANFNEIKKFTKTEIEEVAIKCFIYKKLKEIISEDGSYKFNMLSYKNSEIYFRIFEFWADKKKNKELFLKKIAEDYQLNSLDEVKFMNYKIIDKNINNFNEAITENYKIILDEGFEVLIKKLNKEYELIKESKKNKIYYIINKSRRDIDNVGERLLEKYFTPVKENNSYYLYLENKIIALGMIENLEMKGNYMLESSIFPEDIVLSAFNLFNEDENGIFSNLRELAETLNKV